MRPLVVRAFVLGGALAAGALATPRVGFPAGANPCAAKNPCAPRSANPCAVTNPCAAKNPCGAKPGAVMKDPTAEAAFKRYRRWMKVNAEPVLSATHGNRYVFTYLNTTAEPSGLQGKFPFPEGAVLAKESFEGQSGKPGPKGPLFIMEKRAKGYDAGHGDWHYAVVAPDGKVSMTGSGKDGSPTQFCAACHTTAKINDYVFGNGTIMKVKPTAMGVPAGNPCAAKNPCAPKNPCAGKK